MGLHASLDLSPIESASILGDDLAPVEGATLLVYAIQVSDLLQVRIVFHYLLQCISLVLDRGDDPLLELDLLVRSLLLHHRPGYAACAFSRASPACRPIWIREECLLSWTFLRLPVGKRGVRVLRSHQGLGVVASLGRLVLRCRSVAVCADTGMLPFLAPLPCVGMFHGLRPLQRRLRSARAHCSREGVVREVQEVDVVDAVLALRAFDQIVLRVLQIRHLLQVVRVQILISILIAPLVEEVVHGLLSGELQEHVVDQVLRCGLPEALVNFWDAEDLLFEFD